MKVLCIHGVGEHAPGDTSWQDVWRESIRAGIREHDAEAEFRFVQYDELFSRDPPETDDYLRAVGELLAGQFDWRSRAAALGEFARSFSLRWTAGMVAQWITDDELREASRDLLIEEINDFRPRIVAAHSLGSLIAYDQLTR